jgi:hypothetical protein|tara:strand:- start:5480 stop:5689 length:210 start_codon:yes stop_codon:yes gene_type:complete
MVQDNSYPLFKEMTTQCILNKVEYFYWNEHKVDVIYAKYVCAFVDTKAVPDYEEHLQERMHEPDFDYEG